MDGVGRSRVASLVRTGYGLRGTVVGAARGECHSSFPFSFSLSFVFVGLVCTGVSGRCLHHRPL